MLLWDLSAAFDTLDKETFIKKLELYGFDESSVKWFSSYLSNRRQIVQIGEGRSEEIILKWGSPQGAILSPLIFTIYMADIELWMEHATMFGYADDTSTTVSGKNLNEVCQKLEEDSENVLKFMASNGLVANPDKTGLLIFRNKNKQHSEQIFLKIEDNIIFESDEQKLLGMTLSKTLNWQSHISKLIASLNQRTTLIRRLRQWVPMGSLTQLAQGLILSKIRYCLPVYGQPRLSESDTTSTHYNQIQKCINNVMRTISGKRIADKVSIKRLHKITGLPSLNQMTVQAVLMEAWKIVNGKSGIENILEPVSGVTRAASASNVKIPLVVGGGGFTNNAAKLWNVLPQEIKLCKSEKTPKNLIKEFSKSYQ